MSQKPLVNLLEKLVDESLESLCRVCLKKEDLTSTNTLTDSIKISHMLKHFCSPKLKLHKNTQICSNCLARLIDSYRFKLKCLEADKVITEFLKTRRKSHIPIDCIKIEEIEVKPDLNELRNQFEVNNDFENDFLEERNITVSENLITLVKDDSSKVLRDEICENDEKPSKLEAKQRKPVNPQCFTCGKILSSRYRLNMHLLTHSSDKPYKCQYCNKTFTVRQNLKSHEKTHSGVKLHKCPTCGKSFTHRSGLLPHMRKHTGETPYKCKLCNKSFRVPSHLKYHMDSHSGEKYECTICNKGFVSRSNLNQHISSHTKVKKYVCDICGAAMSRTSHLNRHILLLHKKSKELVKPMKKKEDSNDQKSVEHFS